MSTLYKCRIGEGTLWVVEESCDVKSAKPLRWRDEHAANFQSPLHLCKSLSISSSAARAIAQAKGGSSLAQPQHVFFQLWTRSSPHLVPPCIVIPGDGCIGITRSL